MFGIINKFKDTFSLDLRSLSLMRIALGLVLIYDLCSFWPLSNFYLSDEGFIPAKKFLELEAHSWTWSILFINSSVIAVQSFLVFHLLTILSFLFGYRTRLSTFLLWVEIVSLHNRNWSVLNGGDDLIRCILLILIILPLGKCFSLDHYFLKNSVNKRSHDPKDHNFLDYRIPSYNHYSFINLAFFVQLAIMYLASAIFKNHPYWNQEYSALYYALSLDLFVRDFGLYIRSFYPLTQFLTFSAYYIEYFGTFILLLGFFKKFFVLSRYLIVICFISFHLGIDSMLNVGTFPYFAICLWISFLPGEFWTFLNTSKKYDFLNSFNPTLTPLAVSNNSVKRQSLFLQIILKFNHFLLGTFLVLNTLFWSVNDKDWDQWGIGGKDFWRTTNRWLHTYQNWHLFAPYPKTNNIWFEMEGIGLNGEQIDLFKNIPRSASMNQQEIRDSYQIEKWRKILMKIETDKRYGEWLAQYYCKNKDNITELKSVIIYSFNSINTGRNIASQREKKVLTQSSCGIN